MCNGTFISSSSYQGQHQQWMSHEHEVLFSFTDTSRCTAEREAFLISIYHSVSLKGQIN